MKEGKQQMPLPFSAFGFVVTAIVVSCFHPFVVDASQAITPPMGWNSYDSFLIYINETQYRSNVQYMSANLKQFGYEYAVIDEGWYNHYDSANTVSDDGYSRVIPDPNRWPSAKGTVGFQPLADYVHSLGLKLGIHVMRGIHKEVVAKKQPIWNTTYHADDIAVPSDVCKWNGDWYGVNMSHPAAQAYYDSLLALYTQWGVDFIKVDCIFGGRDGHEKDIIAVSNAITKTRKEVVLSLSPGLGATPAMGTQLHQYVNVYRITDDLWDCYDSSSKNHPCPGDGVTFSGAFSVFAQFQNLIGVSGLNGNSWPDGDMLPLGVLSPPDGSAKGPTAFTQDEQYSLFTLWAIFKNPLMFGGDMTRMDNFTYALLTNKEVLQMHSSSTGNQQVTSATNFYVWKAVLPNTDNIINYVALFNTGSQPYKYTLEYSRVGIKGSTCTVRDLWGQKNLGNFKDEIPVVINVHGALLYTISLCS